MAQRKTTQTVNDWTDVNDWQDVPASTPAPFVGPRQPLQPKPATLMDMVSRFGSPNDQPESLMDKVGRLGHAVFDTAPGTETMGYDTAASQYLLGGATLAKAAEMAVKPLARGLAPRLYESALKPRPRMNSVSEVSDMIGAGLKEGIPVSPRGLTKSNRLIEDIGRQVEAPIAAGAQAGQTVNKFDVASRLGGTAKEFATQVNPEADLSTLSSVGNEFLRTQPPEIPVDVAQALKQGTYRQLKGKAYGELKGADIESQKSLARGLKEELETLFPSIKGLNQRQGTLINLQDELQGAINRSRNREMLGIGTPITTGAIGAATGSAPAAAAGGAIKSMLEMPGIKSRIAIALSKLGARP